MGILEKYVRYKENEYDNDTTRLQYELFKTIETEIPLVASKMKIIHAIDKLSKYYGGLILFTALSYLIVGIAIGILIHMNTI